MPLKIRKEWVELPDGNRVEREFYEVETPVGKLRKQLSRKTPADPAGYTWSLGYNNLVGRYSQDRRYSKFGGSSLCRSKQLKLDYGESPKSIQADSPDLSPATNNILRMARKVQAKMSAFGGALPGPFVDLVLRCDPESREKFKLWVSEHLGRDIQPVAYGIHMLSPRSRGKIKDKATAFFRACPGNRVFCTLTFVAAVDDQTGVHILNKYLTALRKEFPKLQYLWVAERQLKNKDFPNNIHFHIILNKRLPIGRWNAMWVLQQYNQGLAGHDEYGELIEKQEIERLYAMDVKEKFRGARGKNGKPISRIQKVLNPMDIKRVRSIAGLSMYLTKYITKQEKGQRFACATWHCSRRVSRMFTRTTVSPSTFRYMQSFNNFKVDKDTGECWNAVPIVKPFYTMVYINNKAAPLPFLKEMEQVNKWILGGLEIDRLWMEDDVSYKKWYCRDIERVGDDK
jgi:hypothetical protein